MLNPGYNPTHKPGQPLTSRELNRLREQARVAGYPTGGAGLRLSEDPAGQHFAPVASNTLASFPESPPTLTANQDDYFPGDTSWLRLATDASRRLTGLAAGYAGRLLLLTNAGSFDIVLRHADTASALGNRLFIPTLADLSLPPNRSVWLVYDLPNTRWEVLDWPAGLGGGGTTIDVNGAKQDGTPVDYPTTSTIAFDHASGLSIDDATGTPSITIIAADGTVNQSGVVNNLAQSWKGIKNFFTAFGTDGEIQVGAFTVLSDPTQLHVYGITVGYPDGFTVGGSAFFLQGLVIAGVPQAAYTIGGNGIVYGVGQYGTWISVTTMGGIVTTGLDVSTTGPGVPYQATAGGAVTVRPLPLLRLFSHHANAGNSTTTETDLYSDTTAAGQLGTNDDVLEAQYGGVFVSSATATRQVRIYFAGTAIFDTGALTLSLSSAWVACVTLVRVSASVVRYLVSFTTEGAALAAYTAVGELTGLTLSGTNVLKITGQAAGVGAATNDIVAKLGAVQWKAAS